MSRPIPSVTLEVPPESVVQVFDESRPWGFPLTEPTDVYVVQGDSVVLLHFEGDGGMLEVKIDR